MVTTFGDYILVTMWCVIIALVECSPLHENEAHSINTLVAHHNVPKRLVTKVLVIKYNKRLAILFHYYLYKIANKKQDILYGRKRYAGPGTNFSIGIQQ